MKTYLEVPYAEKDAAKSMGAKWDAQKKAWYVVDADLIKFQRWFPAASLRPSKSPAKPAAATKDAELVIYTDGSCYPNPDGPGGWGVFCNDGREARGGEPSSTNNRMEMQAMIEALKIAGATPATIYTDSEYVRMGLTTWLPSWKKKGKLDNGKIKNPDLWRQLDVLMMQSNAEVKWCKGHNNNFGNDRADALALAGRLQQSSH